MMFGQDPRAVDGWLHLMFRRVCDERRVEKDAADRSRSDITELGGARRAMCGKGGMI